MAEDLKLVDMWQGSKKELKMKKLVNVLFQDRETDRPPSRDTVFWTFMSPLFCSQMGWRELESRLGRRARKERSGGQDEREEKWTGGAGKG